LLEFCLRPRSWFGAQCVHSKSESKRQMSKVYKCRFMSFKVNEFLGASGAGRCGLGVVYNVME
jgi:hypothetical protein